MVLSTIIYWGWEGSDTGREVATSSLTDVRYQAENAAGKKSAIPTDSGLGVDIADISDSATDSLGRVVAELVSSEEAMATQGSLIPRTSLLISQHVDVELEESPSVTTAMAVSSAFSAISSAVETASANISSIAEANSLKPQPSQKFVAAADQERDYSDAEPVAAGASTEAVDMEPAPKTLELEKPSLKMSDITSDVPAQPQGEAGEIAAGDATADVADAVADGDGDGDSGAQETVDVTATDGGAVESVPEVVATVPESVDAEAVVETAGKSEKASLPEEIATKVQEDVAQVSQQAPVVETDPEGETEQGADGGIVYEEHFIGDTQYQSSVPALVAPKRTFRKTPKYQVKLALIIDDLGYNVWVSKKIAKLPADITLAVLPKGQASHDVVRLAQETDKELILHQPMQPLGYPAVKPGPMALLQGMGREKMRRVLEDNLDEFSTAVGINNHMGSFLTTQADAMDVVMEVLAERKLFFVDSRTSIRTVAESRARVKGVPTVRRDVFIDNAHDKEPILKQLHALESQAYNGPVVGIGHPYPGTLAALKEWLPTLSEKGIVLARVSQLLKPESARAPYPAGSSMAAR